MPDVIRDARYPLCSKAGVLRKPKSNLVVSTSALYEKVGDKKYRDYLPIMQHASYTGPTPQSCEKFLASLNGERQ